MPFLIDAIGTAVPTTTITQDEAMELARVLCTNHPEEETWLPTMYHQTGIDHRHMSHPRALIDDILHDTRDSDSPYLPTGDVLDRGPTTETRMRIYAEEVNTLALKAAEDCFSQSVITPEEITHLITVSCTGFHAPGVDRALITGLNLPPTVQRTHVGFMGCHGALNGLRVAQAFANSDPSARVMLCAAELCSLHYHYGWDPQKIVANALFADGAAVVLGMPTNAGDSRWTVRATGSCLIPNSAKAMTWSVGNHGFDMTLSKKVPKLIEQHLRPWLSDWLKNNDCSMESIQSWAIHPGGPRILEAVENCLELKAEDTKASRSVFADYGNMSSPTVLFILQRLCEQNAPRPCVALGFGPGLVAEAVLFG